MIAGKTTTHLKLATQRAATWLDQLPVPMPLGLAIVVFLVAGSISALGQFRRYQAAPVVPTPALVIMIATPMPAIAQPTAPIQVAAVAPARYVVAFASPNGDVLGPIVAPSAADLVARFGDGWYMAYHDGAPVWIRASELGLQLADLAPERVFVVQQAAPPAAPAYSEPPANVEPPPQQAPEQAPAAAPVVERPAQPVQPPADHPNMYPQSEAQMEWNRVQLCAEHPEWNC